MPEDDDAYTIDTRRGAARPPRGQRPPRENAQQIPVRTPMPRRPRPSAGATPDSRPDSVPGAAPDSAKGSTTTGSTTTGSAAPGSTRAMPTRPSARPAPAPGPRPGQRQGQGPRPAGPGGPGDPRDPRDPRAGGGSTRPPRRKPRWRRFVLAAVAIVALWAILLVWAGMSAWGKVTKVDALPSNDKTATGKGTNVVLVGSDSRAGLSSKQAHDLGTGGSNVSAGAAHTDSIMILHLPDSGSPTLVSVPRDSWVTVPGHNKNKINATFTIGGPKLLIETIEQNTGLHIDDYMEIGFGGFASVVDSVGGVRMCLPEAVNDPYAHINLKAGCQVLNGKDALGYVRSRHAFATGDLARVQHQREFLAALTKKIASPTNLLLPWRLKSVGASGAQGVAVNKEMSPLMALKTMWALKNISNGGTSVQVPVGNAAYQTYAGEAVLWDSTKAAQLWDDLRNDRSVSSSK